jgi:ADP-heptose:LPS heptosyltransferase
MKKILIIKLGAKGDVIRTLPILIGIKEKYPDSEIYWITKENIKSLVEKSPYIKKTFCLPYDYSIKEFDILYNFDIENDATLLAKKISAKEKFGFYSENDYPIAFNSGAEYYLNTIFDDEIKKTNKKSYQEMMFMASELKYKKQFHPLSLDEKSKKYALEFIELNNLQKDRLIGIHMGASPRWPSKVWAKERLIEFINKAKKENYEILLFGGPNEIKEHKEFSDLLKKQGIKIYLNEPTNTDLEFASLVNCCRVMVCSDSFALHISVALKRPTIGLFFCTSPDEVEDYGVLKKIVSPLIYDFFPEKMDQFNKELVNSISTEEVLRAIKQDN